jgi:heptosyltransferase-2
LGEGSRVLSNPVDCSPCFQRQCPLGHLKCLEGLVPEQVIEVL